MKKAVSILLSMICIVVLVSGCASNQAATFTKDAKSTKSTTFTLVITDTNKKDIVNEKIKVVGEKANLMEIMTWYLGQKNIKFESSNGLVTTIKDLASDKEKGWLVYVGDKMADVGAADLIPADGSTISWKYVNYSEAFPSSSSASSK